MKQTLELGTKGTNSVLNWIMGNNQTVPEPGQWVTQLHYVDRSVYKVAEVSDDLKIVKLEYCNTSADQANGPLEMGHQSWKHEPCGQFKKVKYRNLKRNPGWYVLQNDGQIGERVNLVFGSAEYYYCWEF